MQTQNSTTEIPILLVAQLSNELLNDSREETRKNKARQEFDSSAESFGKDAGPRCGRLAVPNEIVEEMFSEQLEEFRDLNEFSPAIPELREQKSLRQIMDWGKKKVRVSVEPEMRFKNKPRFLRMAAKTCRHFINKMYNKKKEKAVETLKNLQLLFKKRQEKDGGGYNKYLAKLQGAM